MAPAKTFWVAALSLLLLAGCISKPAALPDTAPTPAPRPPPPPLNFITAWQEGQAIPRQHTCYTIIPDPPPTPNADNLLWYWIEILIWVLQFLLPGQLGPEVKEPVMPHAIVSSEAREAKTVAGYLRDASAGDYVNWIWWNVPVGKAVFYPEQHPDWTNWWTTTPGMTPTQAGGVEGRTSGGEIGYEAMCPQPSLEPHVFKYTVYTIEGNLTLQAGADYQAFAAELAQHKILQEATISGKFSAIPKAEAGAPAPVSLPELPGLLDVV